MKRHWDWHSKQGESWKYFVWTVDTGRTKVCTKSQALVIHGKRWTTFQEGPRSSGLSLADVESEQIDFK